MFIVLLLAFAAIVALCTVVHEYAHVGAARAFGIRVEGPHWADLRHLELGVTFADVTHGSWQLTVVHYAGGLVPGLALLGLHLSVFLSRGYAERSVFGWAIGLFVATLGIGQLGQGLHRGHVA